MPEKFQFFDGKRFTRDDKTGYYLCATADDGKRKRMHVYVWEYFNGPVPKGYHIHHIDGDKSNNNIKNLQLLLAMEHEKLHGSMWTDEQRNRARKNNSKYHNTSNHKHHHLIYTYYRPLELRVTIQCITNRSNHFFWQLIVLHLFEDSTEHMIFQQRSSVGTWQIRQYFLQAAAEI